MWELEMMTLTEETIIITCPEESTDCLVSASRVSVPTSKAIYFQLCLIFWWTRPGQRRSSSRSPWRRVKTLATTPARAPSTLARRARSPSRRVLAEEIFLLFNNETSNVYSSQYDTSQSNSVCQNKVRFRWLFSVSCVAQTKSLVELFTKIGTIVPLMVLHPAELSLKLLSVELTSVLTVDLSPQVNLTLYLITITARLSLLYLVTINTLPYLHHCSLLYRRQTSSKTNISI